MNKLKNFVYLSICEVSLDLFNSSFYSTYLSYCTGMRLNIFNNNLTKKNRYDLMMISKYLESIYGFNEIEIGELIVSYFESDRFNEFQKLVLLNESVFPSMDSVKAWVNDNS
jgi:hypothetical protein